ncbi:alpha subunit of pyruvate dehydrogenase [Entomophthora muscae]|uniref:Alpha subunit of pyruvate dehydrogenase n=1 Tax=Entomophthora muscae TaxID=34485 RepID=A0ACC2T4H7_9FUNG|nr:alpha subunit of pyruvate dehydrogenase [Entomophthora muscae]
MFSLTRTAISKAIGSKATRQFSTSFKAFQTVKVNLPETSFETYQLEKGPENVFDIDSSELMRLYREMVTIRRMEMAADGLYKSKMIRGFCHLCTGQEAVASGMESAITKEDNIITAYRCHGYTHARGGSIKSVLSELLGRRDGISHGKGGSMHMFAKGFFGGNGIVGAQVPVGAGIAFAQWYKGQNNVTFALYGDGASNQGQVFEAYNMAKLWNLPAIFVCENNKYGMGTSANRSSASTNYFTRGDYIPGIRVNGMDVLAVRQACAFAKEYSSNGNGPLVLEMVTYRYGGHSMSDPGTTYRTREEIQNMRSANDPIQGLKHVILNLGVSDENSLKQIDKEARAVVDEATKEAKASPEPELKDFWVDVYAPGTEPPFLRGREPQEVHYYN